MRRKTKQSGVTLVEIIIGISIISMIVVAVGVSVTSFVDARSALLDDVKTLYLVEEGHELIKALRSSDWSTFDGLALDTIHYLDVSTSSLAFSTTPEVIDSDFYRSFIIREVYRDGSDDFATSTTPGATVDPDMKEVHVYVQGPNGTTSMPALLANIYAQ